MRFCFPVQNFAKICLSAANLWPKKCVFKILNFGILTVIAVCLLQHTKFNQNRVIFTAIRQPNYFQNSHHKSSWIYCKFAICVTWSSSTCNSDLLNHHVNLHTKFGDDRVENAVFSHSILCKMSNSRNLTAAHEQWRHTFRITNELRLVNLIRFQIWQISHWKCTLV